MLKKNFVNTLEGDDFAVEANKLTRSMSGLKQINTFIDLCSDHENDFAPDRTASGAGGSGDGAGGSNKR